MTTALLLSLSSLAGAAEKLKLATAVYIDEKGGSLKNPEGAACNDKGTIVIADTGNGRLLGYTWRDGELKGGTEIRPAELSYPVRVQLDSKGNIFALDEKQHRIVKLSSQGGFTGYVEPKGVAAPAPVVPRSFKVGGGDAIYILDIFGTRVLVLDGAGQLQRQIPLPKTGGFFSDLAVTAGGDILVLDSVNATVSVARKDATDFAPLSKSLREYVSFPTYITTDARGTIHVVDQNGGTIITLGGDGGFTGRMGVMGWKEGQLYYPGQICFDGTDLLAVADRGNSRLQLFELVK